MLHSAKSLIHRAETGKDEQFAFKRALSRLLEMTSEYYAREEHWTPLPASARKWETSSLSSSRPPARATPHMTSMQPTTHDLSDFAEEASLHDTHAHIHFEDRPAAPRLSADHVWGVREDWGNRAGSWGRGAAAFDSPTPPRALRDSHGGARPRRHEGPQDDSATRDGARSGKNN